MSSRSSCSATRQSLPDGGAGRLRSRGAGSRLGGPPRAPAEQLDGGGEQHRAYQQGVQQDGDCQAHGEPQVHADRALLGALAWWAGDIAVLWACFHAFGEPPALAVVVMAYFTGMLGNVLPLPGGVGGVEGG